MEAFWSSPSENVLDRATAMLPRLMYERLDDLGIDFSVVYPTAGLGFHRCRTRGSAALSAAPTTCSPPTSSAGSPIAIIPAAIIPMYTPEEAIEELEFAVEAARLQGGDVRRPHAPPGRGAGGGAPGRRPFVEWYDVIGIDSPHDYDPVWAKCRELRVAPSFHNGARSILLRNSPSNFCYNHIGHFASAGHAVAKALFFGGVTRRFPDLNFAFLEGGVGWACMLYADLIGHWEKRNRQAIESDEPEQARPRALLELARRSTASDGGGRGGAPRRRARGRLQLEADRRRRGPRRLLPLPDREQEDIQRPLRAALLLRLRGRRPDERWAFNRKRNPLGARLNALFSSDIGHFDVPDMTDVVPEAYELVEHGLHHDDDFRDFMFTNAVRFWGEVNPDFFKGTAVEKAAAEALAQGARVA